MRRAATVVAACALSLVACGDDDGGDTGSGAAGSTLTVFAASSLTDAFGELEQTYEADNPGVDVQFTFDSSSTLAEQVVQGAPVDVLATADENTMQTVVDEGLTAGAPIAFAQNSLILVTPPDDPGGIQDVADLDARDVDFAVCAPDAPCGAATQMLFGIVGVTADPVTEEENVRDVLAKVTQGEVDAGLVYVSDAQAAGDDVVAIEIGQADQALNSDVIAALSEADDPEAARAWVDLITSAEAEQVLTDLGFLRAP
ncbi:MAG: molybdate ABC transporter substrate-binding protein [Nocardioidaceae bacterium]|nr:molybdate ABC transporter substrate-binding protein [Nocardioidaceae bacterium]